MLLGTAANVDLNTDLRNGARVIARQRDRVLCIYHGDYVVWTIDCDGYTYGGHYFSERQFDQAIKEFRLGV